MASVELSGVWIAPVSDLSDELHLNAGVKGKGNISKQGRISSYAGGRTIAITRPGTVQSFDITAKLQTRTTREKLESWEGALVLVRDGRGHYIYGMFFAVPHEEIATDPEKRCNLSISVDQVTHSEVVQ